MLFGEGKAGVLSTPPPCGGYLVSDVASAATKVSYLLCKSAISALPHVYQSSQIIMAVEEWQPGFHRSLSNITDSCMRLHFDEVREMATSVLERIYQKNVGAWVKFSTMVHSPSS
jgi:hypothetical protein